MRWTDIDGWLNECEGQALQELARGKTVLELGSYKGRSAVCMAETARRVVSVDKHQGEASDPPSTNTARQFRRNLESAGVDQRVDIVNLPFEQLSDSFLIDGRFDMVFIDGAHDADSAERDTRIALKTGAKLVVFHDANYPSVQEGARRAGLQLREVAGGIAVGEPIAELPTIVSKPKVALVMPRYGPSVCPAAAKRFWVEQTAGAVDIVAWLDLCQSIVYAFNAGLAQSLDWRDQGMVTHIAMIHADVVPAAGWLDTLWAEMQEHQADLVSAVIPIKDASDNPRTSTAIHDQWNPWFPKRYVHIKDRGKMPETFGPKDVCGPDEILSLNTGLWLADLRRPWWDYFNWTLDSRIVRHEGKRIVQMRSEDWEMSRHLHDHAANVRATWKIPIEHLGEYAWSNHAKAA